MKSIKSALVGAVTLAAGAAMANASTILYINGSTAFRSAAVPAIHAAFDTTGGGPYFGYTGTSEGGQNAGIWSGNINSHAVVIIASWTGSESGIQATADESDSTKILVIKASAPQTSSLTNATLAQVSGGAVTAGSNAYQIVAQNLGTQNLADPTTTGIPVVTSGSFDAIVPAVTFSDTYQATGQYKANKVITYYDGSHHTMAGLTPWGGTDSQGNGTNSVDGIVGVIPFEILGSKNWPTASGTNITQEQLRVLYTDQKGYLPLAFFTGKNADESAQVWGIGRNNDSGSRLTTNLISGLGAIGTVYQGQPFNSVTAGTGDYIGQASADTGPINSIQLWAADTVNNIAQAVGNSGYNSGSKIVTALKATNNISNTYLLSYVGPPGYIGTPTGTTKAYTGNNPAVELAFEGIPFSIPAIVEGQYSLFSFEHLYYNTNNFVNDANNVSTDAINNIGAYGYLNADEQNVVSNENYGVGSPTFGGYAFTAAPGNNVVDYDELNVERSGSGDSDGTLLEPEYSY